MTKKKRASKQERYQRSIICDTVVVNNRSNFILMEAPTSKTSKSLSNMQKILSSRILIVDKSLYLRIGIITIV